MRPRFSILLALSVLMLLGLQSFDPSEDSYSGMLIQTVQGKPYLVLSQADTFAVYAPTGTEIDGWTPVYDNRSGSPLGTFELPHPANVPAVNKPPVVTPPVDPTPDIPKISAPPPEKPPEKKDGEDQPEAPLTAPVPDKTLENQRASIGVFFTQNCAVFEGDKKDKTGSVATFPMTLDWNPEASAILSGETFAFGAKLDAADGSGDFPNGVLKAARFDGKSWVEVPELNAIQVHSGKVGFWLKAVTLQGKIAVLWRGAKLDQTIGYRVEGLRIATDGDISMCFFDGTKFSAAPLEVKGLPKGNTSVWADKGALKCLVQTRASGTDSATQQHGRMEIWTISPDGKAALSETIAADRPADSFFANIAANRFIWENHEYILRSNWQHFELWKRGDDSSWTRVPAGTTGLPVFTLERKLFAALIFCALVVLLGATLGFLRRRHALTLMRSLQPGDLNAPMAPRAGAYLVDMLIVVAMSIGVSKLFFDQYGDIASTPLSNVALPSSSLLVCFMLYFTLTEWLLSATPGKFLMGLRVVSDGGARPTLWASLVRNAVGLLERQPIMLIVSFPMVVFSPRRQRLGDLLSRTIVVQKAGLDMFMQQRAAAAIRGEALEKLPGEPQENPKKDGRAK